MWARRVKRTSGGVCSLEEVARKMFSGAKMERVDMRAKRQETKRMLRAG